MDKYHCKFNKQLCEYIVGYLEEYKKIKPGDRPRRLTHREFHELDDEMERLCILESVLTPDEKRRMEELGRLLLADV